MPLRIEAVVFDLGGVLVRLGDLTDILGDHPLPESEFWPMWLQSKTVRDFESGRCDATEFGNRLVAEFGLQFSGEELVHRFLAWPKGLYPESQDLLTRIADVSLAVLSNSNPVHWDGQKDAEVIRSLIDKAFMSHEIGLIKPDPEIFDYVQGDLALPADAILFLDDNQINVDAARRAGWKAELTKGPAEAERHLVRHGVLAA